MAKKSAATKVVKVVKKPLKVEKNPKKKIVKKPTK